MYVCCRSISGGLIREVSRGRSGLWSLGCGRLRLGEAFLLLSICSNMERSLRLESFVTQSLRLFLETGYPQDFSFFLHSNFSWYRKLFPNSTDLHTACHWTLGFMDFSLWHQKYCKSTQAVPVPKYSQAETWALTCKCSRKIHSHSSCLQGTVQLICTVMLWCCHESWSTRFIYSWLFLALVSNFWLCSGLAWIMVGTFWAYHPIWTWTECCLLESCGCIIRGWGFREVTLVDGTWFLKLDMWFLGIGKSWKVEKWSFCEQIFF